MMGKTIMRWLTWLGLSGQITAFLASLFIGLSLSSLRQQGRRQQNQCATAPQSLCITGLARGAIRQQISVWNGLRNI